MATRVKKLYEQMADPKYVISMGSCATSGGPYWQPRVSCFKRCGFGCPCRCVCSWLSTPPGSFDRGAIEITGKNSERTSINTNFCMTFDDLRSAISEQFNNEVLDQPESDKKVLYLKPKEWNKIASHLHSDEMFSLDQLECLTGVDLGEDQPLEVRYNLFSMKHKHKLEIRISTDRNNPNIPSVEQIWRMADWFEREAYDMYGIKFEDHRDMKRILCPDDWEGWPLRKDYSVQETYHGIVVPKIKEGWE